MTTSTPASTSKNSDSCRCNKDCGCCARKAKSAEPQPPSAPAPGFLASRPWIWVFVAFALMFSAWSIMFSLAIKNQPQNVELAHGAKEEVINN